MDYKTIPNPAIGNSFRTADSVEQLVFELKRISEKSDCQYRKNRKLMLAAVIFAAISAVAAIIMLAITFVCAA